jgi:hypothetical protein
VRRFSDEMAFPVYGWQMLEAVAAMIVGFLMPVICSVSSNNRCMSLGVSVQTVELWATTTFDEWG